jgi:hypothetical protein
MALSESVARHGSDALAQHRGEPVGECARGEPRHLAACRRIKHRKPLPPTTVTVLCRSILYGSGHIRLAKPARFARRSGMITSLRGA